MRLLRRVLGVLAVLVAGAALTLRVRYGGATMPFPDTTKAPLLGSEAIEVVAALDEPPGNIAVASDGRVFFTNHPEARPAVKVAELVNGKAVPYPNAEWQKKFVTPLSLRIDRQGRLWALDIGYHGLRHPRLYAFDLANGSLVHQWDIPGDVAGIGSFVQDFQIDPEGRWLYFADLSVLAKHPALIVYDSHAKTARRVLQGHPSVQDRPYRIVNRGMPMILLGGLYAMHPAVDSIALDARGEWLYYGPMSHDTLFRVRASELRDAPRAPRVEAFGPKPQTDGIAIDDAGNVYMTEVEHGTLALLRADRTLHTLVRDERLRWPDGLSLADGWLYVTDSDLAHVVLKSRSTIAAHRPYFIYRVRLRTASAKASSSG